MFQLRLMALVVHRDSCNNILLCESVISQCAYRNNVSQSICVHYTKVDKVALQNPMRTAFYHHSGILFVINTSNLSDDEFDYDFHYCSIRSPIINICQVKFCRKSL